MTYSHKYIGVLLKVRSSTSESTDLYLEKYSLIFQIIFNVSFSLRKKYSKLEVVIY